MLVAEVDLVTVPDPDTTPERIWSTDEANVKAVDTPSEMFPE